MLTLSYLRLFRDCNCCLVYFSKIFDDSYFNFAVLGTVISWLCARHFFAQKDDRSTDFSQVATKITGKSGSPKRDTDFRCLVESKSNFSLEQYVHTTGRYDWYLMAPLGFLLARIFSRHFVVHLLCSLNHTWYDFHFKVWMFSMMLITVRSPTGPGSTGVTQNYIQHCLLDSPG